MTKRIQIGTVEILRDRVYPLIPGQDLSDITTRSAFVVPGKYPLYQKGDEIYWEMSGRINEPQLEVLGEGLFVMRGGHEPTDEEVTITSSRFSIQEFAVFIETPEAVSRLTFTLFDEEA